MTSATSARRWLAAVCFVVVAPTASNCFPPLACTEVGCQSSVRLTMTDASGGKVSAFSGTVEIDGATTAFECPSGVSADYSCLDSGVDVIAEPPQLVRVTVTSTQTSRSFTGDVALSEPKKFYPNGELCPPACSSATGTVTLQ